MTSVNYTSVWRIHVYSKRIVIGYDRKKTVWVENI